MLRHRSHYIIRILGLMKVRRLILESPSSTRTGLSTLSRIMFLLASEQTRAKNSTSNIVARMTATRKIFWARGRPLALATSSFSLLRKSLYSKRIMQISTLINISHLQRLVLQRVTTSSPKQTTIGPETKFTSWFRSRLPRKWWSRIASCRREQ